MEVALGRIAVSVTVDFEGEPLIATAARMNVACETSDGSKAQHVIRRAEGISTIANSLKLGLPVTVVAEKG